MLFWTVRANEGDAYPIGSLPMGTVVCCLEFRPGKGAYFARAAGTSCTLVRKAGHHVIVQIPTRREISIEATCVAVVGKRQSLIRYERVVILKRNSSVFFCTKGRVSNAIHSSIPIGSPNNLRHLGYRPRSGLWQRKTGKHGRKIRPLPKLADYSVSPPEKMPVYKLTMDQFPYHLP